MSIRSVAAFLAIIAAAAVVSAQPVKTPIKGLVSMGAYKFVSAGGQPFNCSSSQEPSPTAPASAPARSSCGRTSTVFRGSPRSG